VDKRRATQKGRPHKDSRRVAVEATCRGCLAEKSVEAAPRLSFVEATLQGCLRGQGAARLNEEHEGAKHTMANTKKV
jgi:hypothetical protein